MNIDTILYGHPLTFEQRKQLLEAEKEANHAHFQTDALTVLEQSKPEQPLFEAITELVDKSRDILVNEINQAPTQENPALNFISGAPGSGKSVLFEKLIQKNPGSVWVCADAVKRVFKKLVPEIPALSTDPRWLNDSFLHRLSSHISWGLLKEATLNKVDIIVETLGKNANTDFELISRIVLQNHYTASIHHVATSKQRAIEGAIKRYFGEGPEAGRHISLTRIGEEQLHIFNTFIQMEEMFKEHLPQVKCFAYDNRQWNRKLFYKRERNTTMGVLDFTAFMETDLTPKKLWFQGENHTADLVLMAQDENQQWNIALIVRDKPPFEGLHALPGGFVETHAKPGQPFILDEETPEQAARREFEEETMGILDPQHPLIPLGVFRDLNRDPRNSESAWIASHAFLAIAPNKIDLKPADDAREACWVLLDDIFNKKVHMAFDHLPIIKKAAALAVHHNVNYKPPVNYRHLTAL